jgi:hypothetical protein
MKVKQIVNDTNEPIEINHDAPHIWTTLQPGGKLGSSTLTEFEVFNMDKLLGKVTVMVNWGNNFIIESAQVLDRMMKEKNLGGSI